MSVSLSKCCMFDYIEHFELLQCQIQLILCWKGELGWFFGQVVSWLKTQKSTEEVGFHPPFHPGANRCTLASWMGSELAKLQASMKPKLAKTFVERQHFEQQNVFFF